MSSRYIKPARDDGRVDDDDTQAHREEARREGVRLKQLNQKKARQDKTSKENKTGVCVRTVNESGRASERPRDGRMDCS